MAWVRLGQAGPFWVFVMWELVRCGRQWLTQAGLME
jgi:hypothetical protein